MKTPIKNGLLLFVFALTAAIGCKPDADDALIVYRAVNKEYVLIRDVETLQASDDAESNHVDSILNGLIDSEIISIGQKKFDLDGNLNSDIAFEIVDLNVLNQNNLPESFDSLAARVIPISIEILDNSTFGYPDALATNHEISSAGHWSDRTSVLGTFMNAGQFQGQGEKFLGFRFINGGNFKYGWVRLYCSQHNDTLRIIDYAYNDYENSRILAGQTE